MLIEIAFGFGVGLLIGGGAAIAVLAPAMNSQQASTRLATSFGLLAAPTSVAASWSCYAPPGTWERGRPPTCGVCGACVARHAGFVEAKHNDPAAVST